ncbi:hypothetical protein COSO111634_36775 [Corallococcus soli]
MVASANHRDRKKTWNSRMASACRCIAAWTMASITNTPITVAAARPRARMHASARKGWRAPRMDWPMEASSHAHGSHRKPSSARPQVSGSASAAGDSTVSRGAPTTRRRKGSADGGARNRARAIAGRKTPTVTHRPRRPGHRLSRTMSLKSGDSGSASPRAAPRTSAKKVVQKTPSARVSGSTWKRRMPTPSERSTASIRLTATSVCRPGPVSG